MDYIRRSTPEVITELGQDDIVVYGCDRMADAGIHGQSYGIPAMSGSVKEIKPYVDEFLDLADEWDQNTFYVTRKGWEKAGLTDEEIAPLFARAIDSYNIVLPQSFIDVILRDKDKKAGATSH